MILAQQASSAYCDRQFWRDVSCGSKTEVSGLARHVRFTLDSVAKLFSQHGTQILRAVGATIE
jgi:hypothetical protein